MRIIAGEFKSRRLLTPRDAGTTRPIPDRVKESLFGLLRGHCEGASVLDAFAGTGALGLEAVSRGAERCVFVEKDRGAFELLRQNIEMLGAGDRCQAVAGDALGPGALSRCPRPVTLVFMDPPYPLVEEPIGWRRVKDQLSRFVDLLTDDGFVVLRTPWPFGHVEERAAGEGGLEAGDGAESLHGKAGRRKGSDRLREGRRARGGAGSRRDRDGWQEPGRFIDDEGDEMVEIEWDGEEVGEVDAGEGAPDEETPAAPPDQPAAERVSVDLTVPNALGPETHVYHTTAVHLYMKGKAGAAGSEQ